MKALVEARHEGCARSAPFSNERPSARASCRFNQLVDGLQAGSIYESYSPNRIRIVQYEHAPSDCTQIESAA